MTTIAKHRLSNIELTAPTIKLVVKYYLSNNQIVEELEIH